MNEIIIINSFDIYEIAWWQFLIGWIPVLISCIVYGVLVYKNNKTNPLMFLLLGGLLSIVLLLSLSKLCPAQYVETRYEIKIEDTALFNEVYDNYIILEEKSDTFIVKERS